MSDDENDSVEKFKEDMKVAIKYVAPYIAITVGVPVIVFLTTDYSIEWFTEMAPGYISITTILYILSLYAHLSNGGRR